MKPTSPEDRDLEKMSSEVPERYRAGVQDEPPARLDAAVLAAARREVEQPRHRSNWQMPASIAAMLVIGVSLVLLVRDNEPPLPSFDRSAAEEAKLAKPAPPQLAMKAQPRPRADSQREARPSRERSARPDHEPFARAEEAAARENAVSGAAVPAAPAPAAPARARDWLGKIDDLLREGKEAEARRQLVDFREHYPRYPLPERLQALLPPQSAK